MSQLLIAAPFSSHLKLLTTDLDELDGLTIGAHGNQNMLTIQSLDDLMSLLLHSLLLLLRVLQHDWRYVKSFHVEFSTRGAALKVSSLISARLQTLLSRVTRVSYTRPFKELIIINPIKEENFF